MVDALRDLTAAHWIVHPRTATALSLMRGSGGAPAFPNINARGGGTLLGLPVVVSGNVSVIAGSPDETSIFLIDADGVALADDNAADFEVARHASIVMDDAPEAGAQQLLSLWQAGLAALRAQRWINWKVRRPSIAAVLSGVTY